MQEKLYAMKFVLGLKEGNDYMESIMAAGIGFVLGIAADEVVRVYVKKLAKEFLGELSKYSKS